MRIYFLFFVIFSFFLIHSFIYLCFQFLFLVISMLKQGCSIHYTKPNSHKNVFHLRYDLKQRYKTSLLHVFVLMMIYNTRNRSTKWSFFLLNHEIWALSVTTSLLVQKFGLLFNLVTSGLSYLNLSILWSVNMKFWRFCCYLTMN